MLLLWNIHSFSIVLRGLHFLSVLKWYENRVCLFTRSVTFLQGFSCLEGISWPVTLKYAAVRVLRTGAFWLNFLGHYLWSVTDITSELQNFLFCFFAFYPLLSSPLRKWSHVPSAIHFSFANIFAGVLLSSWSQICWRPHILIHYES